MVKSLSGKTWYLALFLFCLPVMATAQSPSPDQRTHAVLKEFQEICLRQPPNFARISSFAEKPSWHLSSDRSFTTADGVLTQSKSWMFEVEDGIIEVGTSLRTEGRETTESCGVGAPDIDGDLMRDELIKKLQLGEPEKQSASADGSRWLIFWQSSADGVPVSIMLTHDKEEEKKGIFLNAYLKSSE